MAQGAEDRVQHRVQIPAEVLGQKPQYQIAALLKQLVLPPVAPVRGTVGEMLRTIQLHCHASVRTQEIDLQAPGAIERDGQLRVEIEPPLRRRKRLEAPEEKCLRRTPRALRTLRVRRHRSCRMNEEAGK